MQTKEVRLDTYACCLACTECQVSLTFFIKLFRTYMWKKKCVGVGTVGTLDKQWPHVCSCHSPALNDAMRYQNTSSGEKCLTIWLASAPTEIIYYASSYFREKDTHTIITQINSKTCPRKIVSSPNPDCKCIMQTTATELPRLRID